MEQFSNWSEKEHRTPMEPTYFSNFCQETNTFTQHGFNQFCMASANAYPMNCIQELPLNTEMGNLRRSHHLGGVSEDIEMLHIPSIHETMNNHHTNIQEEEHNSRDWDYLHNSTSCMENVIYSDSDLNASACEPLDDKPHPSRKAPREPLKRLRRQRANDRERRRMKSLNGALNNLKRCIPLPKTKRRVTKLEILRIACHYIRTLWETLNNENNNERCLNGSNRNRSNMVNGMTVSQRLNLLSNNLKFNFQF